MERIIKWSLEEEDFEKIREVLRTNKLTSTDLTGSIEIGELSVEFIFRDYYDLIVLEYDVFVGGVDSGYGYTLNGKLSYDYADGGLLANAYIIDKMESLSDFKEYVLDTVEKFIEKSKYNVDDTTLTSKANSQKLFNWN